jgi:hypothetical protein
MATGGSIKTPPALSKSSSYENWNKEIKVWQKLTDIIVSKQGPAILLSLEGKARDAILELDIDEIAADGGVKKIIDKLDSIFFKDKAQTAYDAYDKFERFQRPHDMDINNYVNEFERLLSKTRAYGTIMSADILAYRLLKSANISENHQQLARATITGDLTYESMKKQLKRIFSDACSHAEDVGSCGSDMVNIKMESINEASCVDNETYYGNYYRNRGSRRGQSSTRGAGNQWRSSYSQRGGYGGATSHGNNYPSNTAMRGSVSQKGTRGKNPVNDRGFASRCVICESINHWAANCPDAQYYQECVPEYQLEETDHHQITLFQSCLVTEDAMKTFVSES